MKSLSKLFEKIEPRGEGEKKFFNLHKVKLQSLVPGTTDDEKTFKATNVKRFDRAGNRFGYNPGQDQDEYDRDQTMRGSPREKGQQVYESAAGSPLDKSMPAGHYAVGHDARENDDGTKHTYYGPASKDHAHILADRNYHKHDGTSVLHHDGGGKWRVVHSDGTYGDVDESVEQIDELMGKGHLLDTKKRDDLISHHQNKERSALGMARRMGRETDAEDAYQSKAEYHHLSQVRAHGLRDRAMTAAKLKKIKHGAGIDRDEARYMKQRWQGLKRRGWAEETAAPEGERIDEISKKMAGRYVKRAAADSRARSWNQGADEAGGDYSGTDEHDRKMRNRAKGIGKAVDKLTKENIEQIDELSKKTLGSYIKQASYDKEQRTTKVAGHLASRDSISNAMNSGDATDSDDRDALHNINTKIYSKIDKERGKIAKRKTGIYAAVKRLTKEDKND